MTPDIFAESMPELLAAALGTLRMTALAFLVAAGLGLPLAILRLAGGAAGRLAFLYVEIVRGMPALTLLFLIYFGLVATGNCVEFVHRRGGRVRPERSGLSG